MKNNRRIPFILCAFASIFVGIAGIKENIPPKQICIRILISMTVFFMAGLYLKNTIEKITLEISQKKTEEIEQEDLKEEKKEKANGVGTVVDYTVDRDEFTPLNLSKAIKTKMNE